MEDPNLVLTRPMPDSPRAPAAWLPEANDEPVVTMDSVMMGEGLEPIAAGGESFLRLLLCLGKPQSRLFI